MNSAFSIIKIIGAWGCLIGAIVCAVLLKDMNLVVPLSVMSIAFAQAPVA